VLLGAVAQDLDIADAVWQKALERMVPKKALDINLKAFQLGRSL